MPGPTTDQSWRQRPRTLATTAATAAAVAVTLLTAGCGFGGDNTLGTAPNGATTEITEPNSVTIDDPSSPPGGATAGTTADGVAVELERLVGHYEPRVLQRYPHNTEVFTQGLEWLDGRLLESGGGWNESSLSLVDHETGTALWRLDLAAEDLFAEGVTVVDDSALQLTWQRETLLITDLSGGADTQPTTPERRLRAYEGQGWGLCFDGDRLVMSDGSNRLTFRHPETLAPLGSVAVTLNGAIVESLNELECVGEQVLANVWQTNTIVVIDPTSGIVEATIDAGPLVPDGYADTTADVLNGIAFYPERGTFWLTGKRWPVLYEVELAAVDGIG